MTKAKNILILLYCLLNSTITMADYNLSPVNQHHSVTQSLMTTAAPDTWLKLGQLKLGTINSYSSKEYLCTKLDVLCTGGGIGLGYNGKAHYFLNMFRYAVTIQDNAGNPYMLTVAFPDKPPALGVFEHNNKGGRVWNTTAAVTNNFSSPSDWASDSSRTDSPAQGYCGNISGCEYSFGAFLHNDSGMPSVYVKLPKNLSARTVSFNDVKVLELELYMVNQGGHQVRPTTAKLYLSGTISVPQRCYIKVDKNSFDFGTVSSNAGNGGLKKMSASVITDCYYTPDNTQQYMKMEAVSGGALNNSSQVYQIDSDSALGIVYNINNNPECNSATDNKNVFNKEYLIRSIPYQPRYTATDKVNFALCKYGMPSVTGQKNVILKLTSRWVVN